ncbi:hypothetical protein SAMN05421876_103379 [Kaistella jeonii]|nr:hypothetical protein SAMN05421876_103379 [Kaistella jeonii]VEI95751.1 Uncharacterised protein [Kaistella jeonii]
MLGTLGSPSIINPIVVKIEEIIKMFKSFFFMGSVLSSYLKTAIR